MKTKGCMPDEIDYELFRRGVGMCSENLSVSGIGPGVPQKICRQARRFVAETREQQKTDAE